MFLEEKKSQSWCLEAWAYGIKASVGPARGNVGGSFSAGGVWGGSRAPGELDCTAGPSFTSLPHAPSTSTKPHSRRGGDWNQFFLLGLGKLGPLPSASGSSRAFQEPQSPGWVNRADAEHKRSDSWVNYLWLSRQKPHCFNVFFKPPEHSKFHWGEAWVGSLK